jgi:hypothetical protein
MLEKEQDKRPSIIQIEKDWRKFSKIEGESLVNFF